MTDISTKTVLTSSIVVAPSATSQPMPRLHFIDGLRGLAMLMVLLYHCRLFGGNWEVDLPLAGHVIHVAALFDFGHVGVNLFLLLSGFCLYWPFVKGGGRREPTLWEFAKKRCRRILPPYYVTLIFCTALPLLGAVRAHSGADAAYPIKWLGFHALMLHNLRSDYIFSLNGSLWSLGLEFQLYILFPLLVEAYRRFNPRVVLLTVLVFCTAYRVFLLRGQFLHDGNNAYVLAYSVFGRCFEFALGMFTAWLLARWHREGSSPLRWPDGCLVAVIIPLALLDGSHGHFQALTDSMWGLLFAALLLAGSRHKKVLHRVLSSRVLVSLGIFSYSVYLVHLPLVIWLGNYGIAHFSNTGRVLFMLLVVAPSMLVLGYLFHLLFEKPFMSAPRKAVPMLAVSPGQK